MKVKFQRTVDMESIPRHSVGVLDEAHLGLERIDHLFDDLRELVELSESIIDQEKFIQSHVNSIRIILNDIDLCMQDFDMMTNGFCDLTKQIALQADLDAQSEQGQSAEESS